MGGGGGGSTSTYYNYQVAFPHQSISPAHPIFLYDAYGILAYTIEPYDYNMNYGTGIYSAPGSQINSTLSGISTATYYVNYSTEAIQIDYDNTQFKISTNLIKSPAEALVWATFEYWATFTPANDTGKIIDGDWSTQMQTVFYAKPPDGYQYAILSLGTERDIQAIDLLGGYFRPDSTTKFDVNFAATMKYSLDGVNYYNISNDLTNFSLTSGESKSFDEDQLGVGFRAKYIMITLDNVDKINYSKSSILVSSINYQQLVDAGLINEEETGHPVTGDTIIMREGMYAVSLTEASAYSDIVIKAEAKLIPTTVSTNGLVGDVLAVETTKAFPSSGSCYIGKTSTRSFTYTGITATSFTGVVLSSSTFDILENEYITETLESDTSFYDEDGLLEYMGDRVFKKNQSDTEYTYSLADLNYLAKEYLKEFYKNHSKKMVSVMYSPYFIIGQTVSYEGLNYFIESVSHQNENTSLTLARYPA